MSKYSLTHLGDHELLRDVRALVDHDRAATALLVAHLAEVDARRLYLPAAHPSMYSYCVHVLGMCEQAAFKRLHAARAARRFPMIFDMLADGRLHLSAITVLAPRLTPENASELLGAAVGRSRSQLERWLAERFPQPDVPTRLEPLSPGKVAATGDLEPSRRKVTATNGFEPSQGKVPASALALAEPQVAQRVEPCAKLAPLSPGRFALQVTLSRSAYELLEYARELDGAAHDLAEVLERALRTHVARLEKQRFRATSKPRMPAQRPSRDPRHVPAAVKREVWRRDQGRCTFVSEGGERCPEKGRVEFDHAEPVARGGRATIDGMRLLCRAHNQYSAEQAFGTGFMDRKRREAQGAARARAAAARMAEARQAAAERAQQDRDLVLALEALKFRADEIRLAVAHDAGLSEAPLEERVRRAIQYLRPPRHRFQPSVAPPA